MNISKLLLSTSLLIMSCSNIHATATETYEELSISDFTYDNLQKYDQIDTNGSFYRINNDKNIYPTYGGYKCYDLKFMINTITSDGEKLTNSEGGRGSTLNLVVKQCDAEGNETYTLSNINNITPSGDKKFLNINLQNNTNLIIPKGIILDSPDIKLNIYNNSSLVILGTLQNTSRTSTEAITMHFQNNCVNQSIIICNYSMYNNNQKSKKASIKGANGTKVLLYPGCIISEINTIPLKTYTIFRENCILYLNRYYKYDSIYNNKNLKGTLTEDMHIVYPISIKNNKLYEIKEDTPDNIDFTKTDYFPNIYWCGIHMENNIGNGTYHFEEPELQLDFIKDESNGNKEVLSIKDDIISKCDVAFWDQCSPDNKNYGILRYITNHHANRYINVNTLEDLFYNGKTYGLLNKMPSEIFVGLIGEKDIKISKNNSKNILLLGDNKQYKGTITIPNNITDIYLKTISKIGKIKYKDKTYYKDNIPNITFHYIDKATLPITPSTLTNTNNNKQSQQNNNVNNNINNNNLTQNKNEFKYIFDLKYNNEIKLDLKDNMSTSHDIVLEDNGLIQNTILWLKGDNRDFKGMLITPKNIETVIFYPNSFCKVINPSGKKLKYKFVDEHGNTDDE